MPRARGVRACSEGVPSTGAELGSPSYTRRQSVQVACLVSRFQKASLRAGRSRPQRVQLDGQRSRIGRGGAKRVLDQDIAPVAPSGHPRSSATSRRSEATRSPAATAGAQAASPRDLAGPGGATVRSTAEGSRTEHGLGRRRPYFASLKARPRPQRQSTETTSTGCSKPFREVERGSDRRNVASIPSSVSRLTRTSPAPAAAPIRAATCTLWPP